MFTVHFHKIENNDNVGVFVYLINVLKCICWMSLFSILFSIIVLFWDVFDREHPVQPVKSASGKAGLQDFIMHFM
jgi:hypothetical protein